MLFSTRHALGRAMLGCLTTLVLATSTVSVHSREPLATVDSAQVRLDELPPEGRLTYRKILDGGPFPYEKDGTVFGNRERLLPAKHRGYYREYTVARNGARNRGAKRIVCGGVRPAAPDGCYYTSDHYASFRRIVQ